MGLEVEGEVEGKAYLSTGQRWWAELLRWTVNLIKLYFIELTLHILHPAPNPSPSP